MTQVKDYSFLYDYRRLHPNTIKEIARLSMDFKESGRDVEIDIPFLVRFDFTDPADVLEHLLKIQLFYRLTTPKHLRSRWMHFHHCQPTKLGGADIDENKVCCPAAVHWYLHELIGQIGIPLENDDLQSKSSSPCGLTRAHLGSLFASNWDPDMLRKVRDSLKSPYMAGSQAEGIARRKARLGSKAYPGRSADVRRRSQIRELLAVGGSIRKVAAEVGCAPNTVMAVKKEMAAEAEATAE